MRLKVLNNWNRGTAVFLNIVRRAEVKSHLFPADNLICFIIPSKKRSSHTTLISARIFLRQYLWAPHEWLYLWKYNYEGRKLQPITKVNGESRQLNLELLLYRYALIHSSNESFWSHIDRTSFSAETARLLEANDCALEKEILVIIGEKQTYIGH